MKKWRLFSAIFQIIVGISAIIAYAFVVFSGEDVGKWTVTLILAIAFVVMGLIGVIDYRRSDKSEK